MPPCYDTSCPDEANDTEEQRGKLWCAKFISTRGAFRSSVCEARRGSAEDDMRERGSAAQRRGPVQSRENYMHFGKRGGPAGAATRG